MFKVRPALMEAFERDQQEHFADLATAYLRGQFPDAAMLPVEDLRSGVTIQLSRARSYGLETERQQATYVTSAWLLGEDFEKRFPAANEVLSSTQATPEEKRQWLEEFTHEIFSRLDRD